MATPTRDTEVIETTIATVIVIIAATTAMEDLKDPEDLRHNLVQVPLPRAPSGLHTPIVHPGNWENPR
jgi:hypothetical protein